VARLAHVLDDAHAVLLTTEEEPARFLGVTAGGQVLELAAQHARQAQPRAASGWGGCLGCHRGALAEIALERGGALPSRPAPRVRTRSRACSSCVAHFAHSLNPPSRELLCCCRARARLAHPYARFILASMRRRSARPRERPADG